MVKFISNNLKIYHMNNKKISYKDAGVNIDTGNQFVETIKRDVKKTFNKNVLGNLGSFSGAYALPTGYEEPVLLSATDGVGTKLKIAIESKRLETVGIDLVAMCVNDLICNFGTPMFFLDYYATGKLIKKDAEKILSGIIKGCKISKIALIGGETAEMPSMYNNSDFDLAGFSVGIAEKKDIDRVGRIKEGQKIIALPSSGLHSNGYSLVRKILFDKLKMNINDIFNNKPLIETLIEPTKIYTEEFLKNRDKIQALAHITGGGLVENIPRILPDNLSAKIDKRLIKSHYIFNFLKDYVDEKNLYLTFNMGVGMIFIVNEEDSQLVCKNSNGYEIGQIVLGNKKVEFIR